MRVGTTRRQLALLGLPALATTLPTNLMAAPTSDSIEIGPDRPVGEPRAIQVEPYIAANPSNPGSLIVSGAELINGQFQARAYASLDAGKSWTAVSLKTPGNSAYSVNTWVTFGGDGTAYYSSLCQPTNGQSFIVLYRSVDEGRSWSNPVQLPGDSYDQPRIIAGPGPGHGVVYIVASLGGIAVLRSADSGATFELASRVSVSNLGNQPRNPILLTDGSLLIPFCDFPLRADQRLHSFRMYSIRSENKGSTFGTPRFVAEVPRAFMGGGGEFATDSSGGTFNGRVYAAWEDGDFGGKLTSWPPDLRREESGTRRELVLAYSNDQGRSWSTPKPLETSPSGPSFMGSIAVSPEGTIGAFWIKHERYETNPQSYRAWFAASLDGGETFTPPVRVSSAVSRPNRSILSKIDYLRTRFRGGDYIGLAASPDSLFHAVWADARDGVFRTFHAPIKVSPQTRRSK